MFETEQMSSDWLVNLGQLSSDWLIDLGQRTQAGQSCVAGVEVFLNLQLSIVIWAIVI